MFPWQFTAGSSALAVPTVTNVVTSGGAVGDIAGGYSATVTGTGFVIGATTFAFGGTAATSVVVSSSTTATMTVPAHVLGSVSVVATTAGGPSVVNGTFEYYSPAQLAATIWQRAPFGGSPWAPTASAGTSGTNGSYSTLGVAPSVGGGLNGYARATFNGTTQGLKGTVAESTAISLSAYGFALLLNPAATAATLHAGATYQDPAVITDDTNGYPNVNYTTSGITLGHYDGTWKEVTAALASGSFALVFAWYDGANINVQVNGGTVVTLAASNLGAVGAALMQLGKNYSGAAHFGGDLEEAIGFATNVLGSSTTRSKLKSYVNTRYALSL